ncbi:5331_t:CDS:2 [Cetraspora pellucida]|uniref:5331_t:CDS:1 n=1 Tax=Cetraspora pellucida TaxID=1433469 RepID=A0ACA9KK77_9GLOM|nr:5331_t:CDS:2 [Cetraspora pellucida]
MSTKNINIPTIQKCRNHEMTLTINQKNGKILVVFAQPNSPPQARPEVVPAALHPLMLAASQSQLGLTTQPAEALEIRKTKRQTKPKIK